ncbi:alpha/beta hydrolase fold domain-containing protein [Lentibacter sp.]|uniref:alpha/beta hydrolase fold domain-containing protein n=1 Tax=Lentibacter sp. TaxID=2024994 RepID=UPI003F6A589F
MSWQLRVMGAVVRPLLRRLTGRVTAPEVVRRHLDRAARLIFRTPEGAVFSKTSYCGLPALWVSSGPVTSAGVLLYIHGGGYIAGTPHTHKRMVARLCRMSGARAFLPAYRLAPEHPIPAALEDVRRAWQHLLGLGYAPEQIVLGGDSAGGGLALALLADLCDAQTPPAGLFAWSPFTDQTFSGASMQENSTQDHFFAADRAPELAAMILGETAPDDPRASPLFARFPKCPPVLLQASHSEILRDDSTRMETRLRAFGADVRLEMWADAPHVWQMLDGWLPEARDAIGTTARWISSLPHHPRES